MVTAEKVSRRPRRLEPDKIIQSVLEIVDAEGLSAVTIRRIAQHHDVTPMALYRHFRDKEELLDAVAERLLDDIRLPERTDAPWHEQLHAVLTAFVDALLPHPAAAPLSLRRFLVCHSGLTLAERSMELLVAGGFPLTRAAEVGTQALCSLVARIAPVSGGYESLTTQELEDLRRRKRALLLAESPDRYPLVVAAAGDLANCTMGQVDQRLALDLVVAGIRGLAPVSST